MAERAKYTKKAAVRKKPIAAETGLSSTVIGETELRSPAETRSSTGETTSGETVVTEDGTIVINRSTALSSETTFLSKFTEGETFIRDFSIDGKSIIYNGEVKDFTISADIGSKFDLEITDGNGNYYNFQNKTFASTKTSLIKRMKSPVFHGSISFPSTVRSTTTYSLKLTAVTDHCGKTMFLPRKEVYNQDGTVNLLESTGSNGNTWIKEFNQGPVVTVSISSMAPTLADSGEAWNGVTHATTTIGDNLGRRNPIKTNFKVLITAATNQAIKINRQPRHSDIFITTTEAIGAASAINVISDEDIWSETARSTGRVVNGAVTSGTNVTMDDDVGSYWAVGDRITGNAALNAKTGASAVTVTAINVGSNAKVFTMSEAIAIADDAELTFTEPHYYRWPITNVMDLYSGSILDPNNSTVEADSSISSYQTFIASSSVIDDGCERRSFGTVIPNVSVDAITTTGAATTTAYGRITEQGGEVVFNNKQPKAFESQSLRFFNYGEKRMSKVIRGDIKFNNLKAEIESSNVITTTINDASATGLVALNDFDVTSKNGIMDDVSIVSGANINTASGTPKVTTIASSTGKNLTLTPGSHYVQNGETLTFTGAATIITLTGEFESTDIGDNNFTMYFDVEKFLTAAYNT